MRTNFFAGLALMALTVAACGGESPPPQAPPPPPPPPPATATASATAAPTETPPPAPPPKPALSEVIPQVLKGMEDADRQLLGAFDRSSHPGNYKAEFYPGPHKFDLPMQVSAIEWLQARSQEKK